MDGNMPENNVKLLQITSCMATDIVGEYPFALTMWTANDFQLM